jgi:RNA-directed DNA polymerase
MQHPWNSQAFAKGAVAAGISPAIIAAAIEARERIKAKNLDLPVILTLGHLAHLAGVPGHFLRNVIDRKMDYYRVFRVKKRAAPGRPKPSRPFRTICVPEPSLMRVQRWIAQNILNACLPHPSSYAFAPDRNLVQAADRHAGCAWLLKMDVCTFFESIGERAVFKVFADLGYSDLVAFQLARVCTRLIDPAKNLKSGPPGMPHPMHAQGRLPQGAPTSPMLANLAVREMDASLDNLARSQKWIYTRYADDLAFSTKQSSNRKAAVDLVRSVEKILGLAGLKANDQKTSIVPPGARKIVLGLLVDRDEPRLTREFRNNLETHLYALTNPAIGPIKHQAKRGFASSIGMERHIGGLLAFAHMVDPDYASKQYARFNDVDWPE